MHYALNVFSSNVSFSFLDLPEAITITTDPLSDIDQPENAVVLVTCSADGSPLPMLSLWTIASDGQNQTIYNHSVAADTVTTSVTLTQQSNDVAFFCRAEGTEPVSYGLDSELVSFNVQCKFYSSEAIYWFVVGV